jgi:AcrR family transcriptional regulator
MSMSATPTGGLGAAVLAPSEPGEGRAAGTLTRTAATRSLRTAVAAPLYTKLKPRPNGPGRERVARHQRARLHGATVEAVAARGYPLLTVSQLVALAGISRRTFYEHFADREECFLASYDAVVAGAARRAAEAAHSAETARATGASQSAEVAPATKVARSADGEETCGAACGTIGLERAFEAFAREVAAEPKAARLALVDVLAAGPAGLERMERTHAAVQHAIAPQLGKPHGAPLPAAVVRGIVGGVWHVARRRLLEGRPDQLPALAGELHRWALCCGSPAATDLPASAPTVASISGACRPERGGHDEHRLVLRTAAELAAREGYAQVSLGRIAHEAGLPETQLSERYGSGEECFLAALELLTAEALAGALRDAQRAPDWATGVQRACATLMRHVAHDRAFARIAFVEVFAAGPAGLERGEGLLRGLSELLLRYAPRAHRPSPLAAEAAVGAIWEIVHHHVAHRTVHQLPGLAGCAAYMVLAPAFGAEEAARRVRAGS